MEVICGSYEDLNVSFMADLMLKEKEQSFRQTIMNLKKVTFDLTLMEIDYPEKFVTLKHQHILGTLMSLGIEREQVGDIIVNERIQFVLTSRLESFIMLELQRIKGASVKLYTIPVTDMIQSNENWKIESATVSSLRLDVVIKEMIRKSRTIAKQLIEKNVLK